MVIHEMFHHFQYNTPQLWNYVKDTMAHLSSDSRDMERLCREDKQFLVLIQNENEVLMEAIEAENVATRDSLISSYLTKRNRRIGKYSAENPDLEQVENYYIIQEGSARYIEYQSMLVLNEFFNSPDAPKVVEDSAFQPFAEFEEIDLNDRAFSYLTYPAAHDYHYTLGFNTMRLLDQLNSDYKKQLLANPQRPLHSYLRDHLKSLP